MVNTILNHMILIGLVTWSGSCFAADEGTIDDRFVVSIEQEGAFGALFILSAIEDSMVSLELRPNSSAKETFSAIKLQPMQDEVLNRVIRRVAKRNIQEYFTLFPNDLSSIPENAIAINIKGEAGLLLMIRTTSSSIDDDVWSALFTTQSELTTVINSFKSQFKAMNMDSSMSIEDGAGKSDMPKPSLTTDLPESDEP